MSNYDFKQHIKELNRVRDLLGFRIIEMEGYISDGGVLVGTSAGSFGLGSVDATAGVEGYSDPVTPINPNPDGPVTVSRGERLVLPIGYETTSPIHVREGGYLEAQGLRMDVESTYVIKCDWGAELHLDGFDLIGGSSAGILMADGYLTDGSIHETGGDGIKNQNQGTLTFDRVRVFDIGIERRNLNGALAVNMHADCFQDRGGTGPVIFKNGRLSCLRRADRRFGNQAYGNACIMRGAALGPLSDITLEDMELIGGNYSVYNLRKRNKATGGWFYMGVGDLILVGMVTAVDAQYGQLSSHGNVVGDWS